MVREGVTSDPYYFKYQVTTLFARKHYPIYPAFEAATEAVPRLLAPKSFYIIRAARFVYTANVLTIKTAGTGNCRGPAGKICTIYGKGL